VTAIHASDQPILRAVEVIRARGSKLHDDLAADEVDLEEAGRDRNGQCVCPAGERRRDVSEDPLLIGGVLVELSRGCRVTDKGDCHFAVLGDGERHRRGATLRSA
jgi:hypothetical protein